MNSRMNGTYKIIESVKFGNIEFVLGDSDNESERYVTWVFNCGGYCQGNYYKNDYVAARKDLVKRLREEIRYKRSASSIPPCGREELPQYCFTACESTGELVVIVNGIKGLYPQDFPKDYKANRILAELFNGFLGVTRTQACALVAGSMFGWNVPMADPKNYDADGNPIMPMILSNHIGNEECVGKFVTAYIGENREWATYSDGNNGEKNHYRDVYSKENGSLLYCYGEECKIVGYDEENYTVTLSNDDIDSNDFLKTFTIPYKQYRADFGLGVR